VTYQGGDKAGGIAAAAPSSAATQTAATGNGLSPEGIHSNAEAKPLPIPPGASPDQVALGDRIFHGQAEGGTCAGCHGTDGRGTAMGSDLASGKWLWGNGSVEAIARTVAEGVPHPKQHAGVMLSMGGAQLSQADLSAVRNMCGRSVIRTSIESALVRRRVDLSRPWLFERDLPVGQCKRTYS
jgi:mono/diheme cytochrome c family protein